ncbi:MAG: DUF4982 domain-containing protein [Bacteroidaceae bacterium]|nr:DUF4982 domain-containing protein [Bacteroidaceae bacterium]
MKKTLLTLLCLTAVAVGMNAKPTVRKTLMDADWLFALGDTSAWHTVSLPHDWSITARFDKDAPTGNDGGYLPAGKGWYKKVFSVESEVLSEKKLRLYFEGVYMNSEVYVNGQRAGGHPYGFTSFFVDITPYVRPGRNEVTVSVDNSQQKNCRWFTGSGIYRHVWLLTTPKQYIDEWSVTVRTPDTHTVEISAEVVMDDGTRQPLSKTLHVEQPRLWSPDDPYLYETVLESGDDRLPVRYGIRTIEYSAQQGLLLNGKPIALCGGCVHHDNGLLGAAAFDRAERRKVELMKQAGFNAVRTAHNPPSETFLDACDELGLLVIDEAFDGWRDKKNAHDYATLIDQWWQHDLGAMVRRDRNHPSIFCWSIGNEVIERKRIEVVRTAHQMAQLCRSLDPTRPVTSALAAWDNDWDIYDPLAAEHDIVGYNYMIHKAEGDHERVPQRVMVQTESYPRDVWQNYRMVMDHSYVVGDFVWTAIDYIGESGIGRWYYDGDTPGEHYERPLFPWHAAYCGDIDLTGRRKPVSHYRSMLWRADGEALYMAVREPDGYRGKVQTTLWGTWPTLESWNWPGWEGKPITVEVCSRYPAVRLFLNDQLVGEKAVSECRAVFTLPYQPGTLRAEGIADGQTAANVSLQTAGEAATIRLTADRTTLNADGQDLAFVTVEIVDSKGVTHPLADHLLKATVKGPARLLAFGNADIKDCDPLCDDTHRVWKGRALIVLRSTPKRGNIVLTVTADGLPAARLKLAVGLITLK